MKFRGRIGADRFLAEIVNGPRIADIAGILPAIDSNSNVEPYWFVMPRARLLADHLGPQPTFRTVVSAVSQIAEGLAALSEITNPVAHRDIKPENMFWVNGHAVIGDFGIADWTPGNQTRVGTKLGAANFLAPEMRSVTPGSRYCGDVYMLAKSLFVLTFPSRGVYPPLGQHIAGRSEFSLEAAGSAPARQLDLLMELATSNSPNERPSMRQMADELRSWLSRNPDEVPRRSPVAMRGVNWGYLTAAWERTNGTLFRQLRDACVSLGNPEGDESVSVTLPETRRSSDEPSPTITLATHGFYQPSEEEIDSGYDGSADNGMIFAITLPGELERLVLGGYVFADDCVFVAEWQGRDQVPVAGDADDAWQLRWDGHAQATFGFPSSLDALERLCTDAAKAWPDNVPNRPTPAAVLSRIW